MKPAFCRIVPTPNQESVVAAKIQDIDIDALDALIARLEEAKNYQLTLDPADIELLITALQTLGHLQTQLSDKDVTAHKLRKLLGIVASSEKLKHLAPSAEQKQKRTDDKQRAKARKPKPPRVPPITVHHTHETLSKGDRCPACEQGVLYTYEPAVLLRVSGQSPYQAERHIMERLRCNACGLYFTASLSEDVLQDGQANQKYGYSARSLIALNKYYMGLPFYRQENLSQILGTHITASTQFDQCESVVNDLQPVYRVIVRLAADATLMTLDDTTHKIIEETQREKPDRRTGKKKRRTGTYASGLIATLDDERRIVLIQTNIGHAGEWGDEILQHRSPGLPPPITMSDALSSNHITVTPVIRALCNAHGRREFADLINVFPEPVAQVLTQYKDIWTHDDVCKEQGLSPADRLAYHREQSLPIMVKMKADFKQQLASGEVEENSGLGKAMNYFVNHYEGLTMFCQVAGVPLDNNQTEAELKVLIRNRKNAYFYKTLAGAQISDILTSMISTCIHASVNPFEYLTWIQQNQNQVKQDPAACLPWNYRD